VKVDWTERLDSGGYRRVAELLNAEMVRSECSKPCLRRRLRRPAASLALAGSMSALAVFSSNFHTSAPFGSSLRSHGADDRGTTAQEQRMTGRTLIGIGVAAATIAGAANAQDNMVLNLDSGGWVQVPHHPSQLPGSRMTIEFWMRSLPSSSGRPVSKRPGSSGCYSVGVSPNAQGVQGTAAEFFACGNVAYMPYQPSRWQHFAYVCEGGVSVRYYRDGRLVDEAAVPTCTIAPGSFDLCFGRTPGYPTTQFFGRLDNIRIWSSARTAAQIASNALLEFTPAEAAAHPDLIGSWSFSGSTASDARGVNDGTLQSGAAITGDNGVGAGADCDGDGLLDAYEISVGSLADQDANGVPDCCESAPICIPCAGDVDGNDVVNGVDLASVLAAWGTMGKAYPGADVNRDGLVDGSDLAQVLSDWGACP
jgi:hypothetical protein